MKVPTSKSPGVFVTPIKPSGPSGSSLLYDKLLSKSKDSGAVFQLSWKGGNTIVGILENEPTFSFAAEYEESLAASVTNTMKEIVVNKIANSTNNAEIGALAGKQIRRELGQSQTATELVWNYLSVSHLTVDLNFTLIATFDAKNQVVKSALSLASLVCPETDYKGNFTGLLGDKSASPDLHLSIGRWFSSIGGLKKGFVMSNISTNHSRSVMVDGYPAKAGVSISLKSKEVPSYQEYANCFLDL